MSMAKSGGPNEEAAWLIPSTQEPINTWIRLEPLIPQSSKGHYTTTFLSHDFLSWSIQLSLGDPRDNPLKSQAQLSAFYYQKSFLPYP